LSRANAPNLGVGIDSFHTLAMKTSLDHLDDIPAERIFLVQLADFMRQDIRSVEEQIATARHFRVFPGEAVHSDQVAALVSRLECLRV
jgi:sugar phosphate isomerase/epimerase